MLCVFFFQAEDGIRDLVRSRGLGDVYKRQGAVVGNIERTIFPAIFAFLINVGREIIKDMEDVELSLIHI